MNGPLPKQNPKRRNKPTFQPATLPAEGFSGPIPDPPSHPPLGEHGRQWWMWVWRTPQASQFNAGHLYAIAMRASLEDRMAALWDDEDREAMLLRTIGEARQYDDRLGLSPKGMLQLRWSVRANEGAGQTSADPVGPAPTTSPKAATNVRRLKVT